MIQTFEPKLLLDPPNPVMVVNERVYRECGCSMFIGLRVDKQELASTAVACSDEHEQVINHFNYLVRESLSWDDEGDRLFSDVADDLMEQAFDYYGL